MATLRWITGVLLLGLAGITNPLVLHRAGVILYTQPMPKSGFWVTSILAFALGLAVLLSGRWLAARRFALSLGAVAFLLILVDTGLRLHPPLEVTGASSFPDVSHPNSLGFLDREPRPSAAHRILVLGDSITFGLGEGVNPHNRYHDLLERALAARGWDVDVQNLSYPGWNFDDYLRLDRQYRARLDPELVVIGWCMNDIVSTEAHGEAIWQPDGPRPLATRAQQLLGPPARALHVNEWYLGTLVGRRAGELLHRAGLVDRDWLDEHNTAYRRFLRGWWSDGERRRALSDGLARYAASLKGEGRGLLIVIFPLRFHASEGDDTEIAIFRDMLGRLGIPFVDLYPAFRQQQKKRDLYSFRDETHPTPDGHRLTASLCLPAVERLLRK